MPPISYQNRVLARLPKAEIARLVPYLFPVMLAQGQILHEARRRVDHAYFLQDGLASIVATMNGGPSVEVGVVGNEGIIGLPVLLGTESMPNRTLIQIPGSGFRIKAQFLEEVLQRRGELRKRSQRYIHAHLVQVSQIATCNRLHEIAERLARWLLMCHDRIASDDLQITHQSLGDMLGAPRTTVTLAAGTLQRAGLVDYSRGRVTIVNRKGLEKATCECYGVIRSEYDRLGVICQTYKTQRLARGHS